MSAPLVQNLPLLTTSTAFLLCSPMLMVIATAAPRTSKRKEHENDALHHDSGSGVPFRGSSIGAALMFLALALSLLSAQANAPMQTVCVRWTGPETTVTVCSKRTDVPTKPVYTKGKNR